MTDIQQCIADLASNDLSNQRSAAAQLLNAPSCEAAAVELTKAVGSDDELLVESATGVLESIESISDVQASTLAELLPSKTFQPHPNTGFWAATLLGRIGQRAAPFLDQLIAALDASTDDTVKQKIVWAIGKIGPPASPASNHLEALVNASDKRLARLASQALESINS